MAQGELVVAKNMKIATWNINGIRSGFDQLENFLAAEKPDVLCLQEVKISPEALTDEIRSACGYHSYWHLADKKGYAGVAIYSLKKPKNVFSGLGAERFDQEGRLIGADFGSLKIINLYFPHSSRDLKRLDFKMDFNQSFFKYLQDHDQKRLIICGDLNVAHANIDLARPKDNRENAGFTQAERDWFSSVLSAGFVDVYRELYPDKQEFTWWSNRRGVRERNIGWRIDYFLTQRPLFAKISACSIATKQLGSDHCPVILEINV